MAIKVDHWLTAEDFIVGLCKESVLWIARSLIIQLFYYQNLLSYCFYVDSFICIKIIEMIGYPLQTMERLMKQQ